MPDIFDGLDASAVAIGITIETQEGLLVAPDALIQAIRANAKASLPECSAWPESLSAIPFDPTAGLALPFFVLLANDPRADTGYAVNDVAHWLPMDFLYVVQEAHDGVTDTTQTARGRMESFLRDLFDDFHQQIGSGRRLCAAMELTATPWPRQNQYAQFFRDQGQQVTVVVATVEFLQVFSLVA